MCYSVSQCVAVCCSVLQCVAVYCSVLRCVAKCCRVLQSVALCCRVLQCVMSCCACLSASIVLPHPPRPHVCAHHTTTRSNVRHDNATCTIFTPAHLRQTCCMPTRAFKATCCVQTYVAYMRHALIDMWRVTPEELRISEIATAWIWDEVLVPLGNTE